MDAIGTDDLEKAQLPAKERALLDYVKVLTLEPARVRDTHVERLRKEGWTDEEIFEATFETSLFAFFNRMADGYGLDWAAGRWLPPAMRTSQPAEPSSGKSQ